MKKVIPVILCGGTGTRLWPLSRSSYPKQFISILGEKTLFQDVISLGDLGTLLREFKVSSENRSINIEKSLYKKLNHTFQFYKNKEI